MLEAQEKNLKTFREELEQQRLVTQRFQEMMLRMVGGGQWGPVTNQRQGGVEEFAPKIGENSSLGGVSVPRVGWNPLAVTLHM